METRSSLRKWCPVTLVSLKLGVVPSSGYDKFYQLALENLFNTLNDFAFMFN